jgi:eukaryotic-like serine/threonine-protein kinase
MQAERWRQIDAVFQSAVDCAPENRPAFLDSACGGDAELRREVESLLNSHDPGWTEPWAWKDAFSVLESRNAKLSEGRRIGAYRVQRELGRGGMGRVYLCARADDEFQKLVAIKVIRRGLDTDDIIERFRSERQILARLDHPNITRLLDGGTTDDGLPYFVMEYIQGEPIDVYCDQHQLNVTERLKLFLAVCSAVAYAHQNLVVHRDIKASNVLLTREGTPRLLDFGIAKLLAPGSGPGKLTEIAVRPLTPEYASPEHVRGGATTTSSDVYSLGVLLYYLLTGQSPYSGPMSSRAEIERSICEEEPDKPSLAVFKARRGAQDPEYGIASDAVSKSRERASERLSRRLQGDLDNIVLTALRKEPQRRYASVEQLAADIKRHLAHFPVSARPDTHFYRVTKFMQRYKAGVAAVTIVFLTLIGGIAATLWQARVARLEQAKAARINAFLQEMVGYSAVTAASPNHQSHEATVADMLDDAAQRVETELVDQPEVKAEMLGTIGGTYVVQAKYELAGRYLHEAYDLDLKLYGSQARQTASVMSAFADLAYLSGDYTAADSWFQKVLPIYRRSVNDADFDIHIMPAALSDAAFVKRALGQLDEAESLWREALSYAPRLPAKYHAQGIAPKTFLAQLYIDRGDVEKADSLATEASQELRVFGGDRVSLAQALIDLGNVRRLERRYAEADASIQEGTDLFARALGGDHPNVAYGLMSLATSRYYQARYDAAELDARSALKIVGKLPNGSHYDQTVYITLGRILTKTARPQQAEPLLRKALTLAQQKSRRPNDVAAAMESLGECLATQKRYAEAEPLLVESYQTFKRLQVPQSPLLNDARTRLFKLYAGWGKAPESRLYAP